MAKTIQIGLSGGGSEPLVCVGGQQRGPVCLSPRGGWTTPGGAGWHGVRFYFDGQALMVSTSSPEPVLVAGRSIGPGWNLVPAPGTVQVGTQTFLVQERISDDGETLPGHAPPESAVAPNSVQRGESTMFGQLSDLLDTPAVREDATQLSGTKREDAGCDDVGFFDVAELRSRLRRRSPEPPPASSTRALSAGETAPGPMTPAQRLKSPARPHSDPADGTMVGLPIGPPPAPRQAPVAVCDELQDATRVDTDWHPEPTSIDPNWRPAPTEVVLDWHPIPTSITLSPVAGSPPVAGGIAEGLGSAVAGRQPSSMAQRMILISLLSALAIAVGVVVLMRRATHRSAVSHFRRVTGHPVSFPRIKLARAQ